MKNAPAARSNESALEQRRFYTDNPRHQRALALLLQRPAKRVVKAKVSPAVIGDSEGGEI